MGTYKIGVTGLPAAHAVQFVTADGFSVNGQGAGDGVYMFMQGQMPAHSVPIHACAFVVNTDFLADPVSGPSRVNLQSCLRSNRTRLAYSTRYCHDLLRQGDKT